MAQELYKAYVYSIFTHLLKLREPRGTEGWNGTKIVLVMHG